MSGMLEKAEGELSSEFTGLST